MILGGDDDQVGGFWSSVGKELKSAGGQAARAAGTSVASYAGQRLTQVSEGNKPAPMPVKSEGIPTGLIVAGGVVLGVGVIALIASGRGKSRPTTTNPRRRRRRRRSRRR